MKYSFLILAIALLPFAAKSQSTRESIAKLQAALNMAVEKNDTETLSKLMHPEFMVHIPGGPYIIKDSLLIGFKSGNNPYKVFQPKEEIFIQIDKNTAITSGKEIFRYKEGKFADKDHHREFYHVWKRYKGNWVIAGRFVALVD